MLTAGADLRYLGQRIDEISNFIATSQPIDSGRQPRACPRAAHHGPDLFRNPLPKAHSSNPGVFCEYQRPVSDQLTAAHRRPGRLGVMNADGVRRRRAREHLRGAGRRLRPELQPRLGFPHPRLPGHRRVRLQRGLRLRHAAAHDDRNVRLRAVRRRVAAVHFHLGVRRSESRSRARCCSSTSASRPTRATSAAACSVYHAWVEDYITLDFLDTGGSVGLRLRQYAAGHARRRSKPTASATSLPC